MPDYAVTATAAIANPRTIGILTRGASKQVRLFEFGLGSKATPADAAILWTLHRASTAGTVSAVTPALFDLADGAAVTAGGENASSEPTYTAGAELFDMALNQRATYRWVALDDSKRLVIPNTAAAGLGMKALHASSTDSVQVQFHFNE